MILECGPKHDRRQLNLSLPYIPIIENLNLKKLYLRSRNIITGQQIGVLVSGGVDSAILYFLLHLENNLTGNKFIITPYTIMRKEGSRYYSKPVQDWIHNYFNLPNIELNVVGNNTLPEAQQVSSGINDIFEKQTDFLYLGIIQSRPEHSIGWARPKFTETDKVRLPFLNLQKNHVIDLYRQFNVLELLNLTYSCAINETDACGYCNGCNERTWGFNDLRLY